MNTRKRVVVTGLGIICSLGESKQQVLDNMKQNRTGIGTITRFTTEKFISHIGAEIVDYQPAKYFTAEEQQRYDMCSQFAIIAAKQALEDSGRRLDEGQARFGVAFGTCNGGINSLEEQGTVSQLDRERTARYPFFQQGDNIALYFGLRGPVNTLNTACAASGNAIGFAYDMIKEGYADVMLAGGADSLSPSVYAGFNVLQALNPAPCSPYNHKYGLSLGEGAAFVVLEALDSALARNARIYAEVCGYGLSSDAYHETAPEPQGLGIQLAVRFALASSGVRADEIDYINTHGTGTKANDAAELHGLRQLFGEQKFQDIWVSSSKAYFGHTLGAAAAIEYVTTLLALQAGLLPATLHFESPREGVDPSNLVTNEMKEADVRYFLCNNSAFGGHNCSIVSYNWKEDRLREAPERAATAKRVAIVGMGAVSNMGARKGSLLPWLKEQPPEQPASFSLKAYEKELYERRMNSLSQSSIGAAHLALQDANLSLDDQKHQIGLFYGTSRGSLESAQKYLTPIFEKGYENANAVYFPDMVLNSTAGKIAKKLQLKGYGTSMSTGGNDGLISTLYGYETIHSGIQTYGLVGAGDERSELSSQLDAALHLDETPYGIGEGSAFIVLMDLETARNQGQTIYAELKGFGVAFGGQRIGDRGQAMRSAAEMALARAGITASEIDFVLLHSAHKLEQSEPDVAELSALLSRTHETPPIVCLNDYFQYCESAGSLFHLMVAANLIHEEDPVITEKLGFRENSEKSNALVVSGSLNGNCTAAVVSKFI